MALVEYFQGTEVQILALQSGDVQFVELAFYYPNDKDYFFRITNGSMKKYGAGDSSGVGIRLNTKLLSGPKILIEENDILEIPENYDYNTFTLNVEGIINCDGQINMI